MRVFSDFDFLIDFKDLVKVQSILEAKGFIPEKTFTNRKEQRNYFAQACEYNFDLYEGNERIFHAEPH